MEIRRTQTIPQDWDEGRDIPFFRLTSGLFPPAFCFGASVLLTSNDDNSEGTITVEAGTVEAGTVDTGTADAPRATADVQELHRS